MRHLPPALLVTALLLLPAAAALADPPGPLALTPEHQRALEDKALLRHELVLYTVDDLRGIVRAVTRGETVELDALGRAFELRLAVNPSFDRAVLEAFPLVYPYAGEAVGADHVSARLTVDLERNALNGILRVGGRILNVEPVLEAGGPLHVWYDNDDALVVGGIAGFEDAAVEESALVLAAPAPALQEPSRVDGVNGSVGVEHLPGGQFTYDLARIRAYYDTGTSPLNILNRMEDIWIHEVATKFRILEVRSISTSGWPTPSCGNSDPFLAKFAQDYPLQQDANSDGSTRNDKALLFTDNANIPAGSLGCAYRPGTHAWAKWGGTTFSDKKRAIIAEQEHAHNFGARHDDNKLANGHYTIMASQYNGDSITDETFSGTSRTEIQTESTTHSTDFSPRVYHYFEGSSVSSHGVELTHWHVDAPRNARANDRIDLHLSWRASSGYTAIYLAERFIGARDCGTDSCNRDFGYLGGAWLYQGGEYIARSYFIPSGGATWTFWPAYKHSTEWGPYKWKAVSFYVSA